MNTERLTKLAEWLEAGAPHERTEFNMSNGLVYYGVQSNDDGEPPDAEYVVNHCRTSCCIAGAAVQFFNTPARLLEKEWADTGYADGTESIGWLRVSLEATELLNLSVEQAAQLFTPQARYQMCMPNYSDVVEYERLKRYGNLDSYSDPAWAARTIRHFLATGEVDWEGNDHHEFNHQE